MMLLLRELQHQRQLEALGDTVGLGLQGGGGLRRHFLGRGLAP